MMKLMEVLHNPHDKYQSVYRCDVCHGVAIDKDFESKDKATSAKRVSAMSHCRLCDDSAPLSKRYSMALDTLAWAVRDRSGLVDGGECCFPSIEGIVSDNGIDGIEIDFRHDGNEYTAARHGYCFSLPSTPDEDTKAMMREFIREEVVSYVILDLAAKNRKTEEEGTL